jgi:mannose-6-phosphate isomerase-like protein (cupin superfamily)
VSGLEVLTSTCNPTTVLDGRGGIFTWVPPEPILEFNLIYYRPASVRGLHYHPEFVEYLLVVEGSGALISRDGIEADGAEQVLHLSRGVCVRLPIGTMHAVYAITPMTGIAMLTRPWDECEIPAVRVGELSGTPSCASR